MPKTTTLTRRQLAVIDDLFAGELDEPAILAKHNVSRRRYEKWLADDRFTEQFERRIARAYREGRMALARYAAVAATRLVELTQIDKEETARKACLDILTFHAPAAGSPTPHPAPAKTDPAAAPTELSQATASRLLAALAEKPGDETATC